MAKVNPSALDREEAEKYADARGARSGRRLDAIDDFIAGKLHERNRIASSLEDVAAEQPDDLDSPVLLQLAAAIRKGPQP